MIHLGKIRTGTLGIVICRNGSRELDGLLPENAEIGKHVQLFYLTGITQPILGEIVERIGCIGSNTAALLRYKLGEQREFRLREEEVIYCSKVQSYRPECVDR